MPRLTRRDLEWTIREAMKEMAPKMYQELKESGKLEEVIQARADEVEEVWEELSSEALTKFHREQPDDIILGTQMLTMAYNNTWNEALQTGIEFDEEPPRRRRASMLTSIPAEVWNAIARETRLQTEWAKKAFPLTDSEMEALEEKESDRLEKTFPRLVVRGFQDMRPLLLERDAIRSWVRKHPEYGNALPEVNTIAEAVAMASTDWMYDETEKKQLESLLNEVLASA